jgi:hypothetical protein
MHPGWAGQAKPAILSMHIRPDQYAFVGSRRLQRYGGATVLYFLNQWALCVAPYRSGRV